VIGDRGKFNDDEEHRRRCAQPSECWPDPASWPHGLSLPASTAHRVPTWRSVEWAHLLIYPLKLADGTDRPKPNVPTTAVPPWSVDGQAWGRARYSQGRARVEPNAREVGDHRGKHGSLVALTCESPSEFALRRSLSRGRRPARGRSSQCPHPFPHRHRR
jgi:hypothetical protein